MPSGADPWDARSGEWVPEGQPVPTGRWPGGGRASRPGPSEWSPVAWERSSGERLSTGPQGFGHGFDTSAGPAGCGTGSGPSPVSGLGGRPPGRGAVQGTGDPVKVLLHRHRELCEGAVDPLEIAVGLEAHGITDRTAAHYRHRDVFSLAEELHARVPRDTERPAPEPQFPPVPRVRAGWVLLTLLPGALGAATVTGLRLTHGYPRLLVACGGLLAIAAATRAALRHGPLAGPPGTRVSRAAPAGARAGRATLGAHAWTLWLLGYALVGDGLLHAVLTGGPDAPPTGAPDGPWPTATAPVLALLAACAPAAWCAHVLAAGARRRLAGSRSLRVFTAAMRPLLLGALALFLGSLAALLTLCGTTLHQRAAHPQALTLGALLLPARLLTAHRHRHAAARALGAAVAVEALALTLPVAARLPGCAFLAAPVHALVDAWGEAAVPALACGTAALALLWHAGRTLARASAHAPAGAPE
ncbi:hypothetical protein [Streptomyces sp. NPDC049590]|uniref:hypothetical protein n=1 Tax=Streptomyces sp. NPDC049590 TaxID=3154834 RepID=UPI003419DAFC